MLWSGYSEGEVDIYTAVYPRWWTVDLQPGRYTAKEALEHFKANHAKQSWSEGTCRAQHAEEPTVTLARHSIIVEQVIRNLF